MPAPMYIFHIGSGRCMAVNKAALLSYGYSRSEFLNIKACDLRPPGETGCFLEVTSNEEDHYAGSWVHQKSSGELFNVQIYTKNIIFNKEPCKLIQAFVFRQELKVHQRLKEKTTDLKNILESITDAFYTVDKQWRFTYTNRVYEQMHNETRNSLIGKNIWEQFPNKKKLRFYNEFKKAAKENITVNFEEFDPKTRLWVCVTAYPFKNGLAIYFRDITEQKRIQEKNHIDEQNLLAIINNTKDLVWAVDKNYKIITGNQAFWDRIKYLTGKEGKQHYAGLDQQLLNEYVNYYKRAFKGEAFSTIRENTINGQLRYEEVSFNPICDQENLISGVSCFLHDITDKLNHQDKIERQNQQLRDIAWIQSHKVRAPLARILGLVQLFVPENNNSDNAEIISMLKTSGEELDEIINEILHQAYY